MELKSKKKFISIKLKISVLTSAITVFCLFTISLVFLYNIKIIMQNKTIEICRNFAENISNVVREDLILDATYESSNSIIRKIIESKIEGLESIYIINVYGRYVVNFDKNQLEDFATKKELLYLQKINALDLQEVYQIETKKNILKITYPIFINYNDQSLKIGAAVFEYDRDKIYEPIYDVQSQIIITSAGITIITLLVSFFLSNYITKPLVSFTKGVQILASGELEHKIEIESRDEVGVLAERFNEMSANLKISYEHLEDKVQERTSELNENLSIIRRDLAMAEKIQSAMLSSNLTENKNLEISLKYIAMTEVGGDYYSVNQLDEFTSRIFLADATGHGVQAALIVMAIQGIFDSIKYYALPPNEVLAIFNNEFSRRYGSLNSYLTCIVLDVDSENRSIRYASGGHPPGILFRKKEFQLLPKTGPLVGAKPGCTYSLSVMSFDRDEKLFIFTDGIFEQFQGEEEFGEERLYSILEKNKTKSIEDAIEQVMTELNIFLDNGEKQDDIAIIGIGYKEEKPPTITSLTKQI